MLHIARNAWQKGASASTMAAAGYCADMTTPIPYLPGISDLVSDYDALAGRHFKFVKIDARTLIEEFDAPNSRLDIDVVDLKRTLERHGIDLIVEKIESEPMLLDVLDLHVDFGQGYLFGEPRVGQEA